MTDTSQKLESFDFSKFLFSKTFSVFISTIIFNILLSNVNVTFSYLAPPITILVYIKKNKIIEAFSFFLVCLFLSDSGNDFFYAMGNNSKNISTLILGLYFLQRSVSSNIIILKYISPFILVAILSTMFSQIPISTPIQKIISYTIICFSVGTFWNIMKESSQTVEALKIIISTFTLMMGWGLLNMFLGDLEYMKFDGRFNGIQRNPNGVGLFSSMMIMLIYVSNKIYKYLKTKHLSLIILIFILTLIFSSSRNGLVTVSIFFIFSTLRLNLWKSMIVILISYYVSDSIFMYLIQFANKLNIQDEMRINTIENASGRVFIWQATWMEIQKNFWFGAGFSFDEYGYIWRKKYVKLIPELLENFGNIHSSYLTLWLNTGIIGVSAFLTGVISLFFKASKKYTIIFSSLVGFLFLGIYESWMVASLNPFTWILWTIPSIGIFYNKVQ